LPPSEALDQWEVRTDMPSPSSPSRKNDAADSSTGTSAHDVDELEIPKVDVGDGRVSAEEFNPDLLKADRASQSKRGGRSATDAPLELPSERRPGVAENADALAQSLAEQAGWQQAARRLKQLGIRKYRLESQIDEQKFVFTCSFAAPENPRVVRRFEADADNPLEAVQLVLDQIDEWRNRDAGASPAARIADEN
jgi:hypothetical protein